MDTGYLFHLVLSRKFSFNNVSLEKVPSRTVRGFLYITTVIFMWRVLFLQILIIIIIIIIIKSLRMIETCNNKMVSNNFYIKVKNFVTELKHFLRIRYTCLYQSIFLFSFSKAFLNARVG